MRAWCIQKRGLHRDTEKQYFIRPITKTLYQHYQTVKLVRKDVLLKSRSVENARVSGGPDIVMNFSKRITVTVTDGQGVLATHRTKPGRPFCHDRLTQDFLAISPVTGIGPALSAPISASRKPAHLPEAARLAALAAAPDLQRPVRQSSPKRSDGHAGAAY